ncbi:MAG TPA: sulfotransferase family protein, partial [Verrucomicrobiae bacterium]
MDLALLDRWVPFRLFSREGEPWVDWGHLDGARFTEPFFEQTIRRCLRPPANVLFRHQTSLTTLGDLYRQRRGLEPAGFIFHWSRCGSTLVSQMLASLEHAVVISEARPIDDALRADAPENERVEWLRWMVSALGQPRHGERRYFIKFDAWHVMQLPLILRAFPKVPWIFLYRDPIEVMVSQQRQRGVQMLPHAIDPAQFGLNGREAWMTRLDEYAAHVLARMGKAAIEFHHSGRNRFVNFQELPGVVWESLLAFFEAEVCENDLATIKQAARCDAKRPALNFESDVTAKQGAATKQLRALAAQWVQPVYERLEQI